MSNNLVVVPPGRLIGATLWDQPNKFARPPGIDLQAGRVTIHGYQEFQVSKRKIKPLPIDRPLQRKKELAGPFFNPEFLGGKTLLDIGANGGFFSLWACRNGARQVVSLDMDGAYLKLIRQAQNAFGWKNIRPIKAKVQDWEEPSDVVLAFAMVHWLYSCTADYGTLDAVIEKLARLSNVVLLVEWVAPDDAAIQQFKHTEWNPGIDKAGYNLDAFEKALKRQFCKIEILGATSPTRTLYAAFRQPNEVTIHSGMPLLFPREWVISSHWLTEYRNAKYYSRVYADPSKGRVIKQATAAMAMHEAKILGCLESPYFPQVVSSEQCDGYSTVVMERIVGASLHEARAEIASTPKRLAAFLRECLDILRVLQAASIRHRDIRLGNVLVRDGHPVLVDFGWAEAGPEKYLSPGGLGGLERIKSGAPCDLYSMGKVFEQIVPRGSKLFSPLLEKMLVPDIARTIPITDLEQILQQLALPDAWDMPVIFPIPTHEEMSPVRSPLLPIVRLLQNGRAIIGAAMAKLRLPDCGWCGIGFTTRGRVD